MSRTMTLLNWFSARKELKTARLGFPITIQNCQFHMTDPKSGTKNLSTGNSFTSPTKTIADRLVRWSMDLSQDRERLSTVVLRESSQKKSKSHNWQVTSPNTQPTIMEKCHSFKQSLEWPKIMWAPTTLTCWCPMVSSVPETLVGKITPQQDTFLPRWAQFLGLSFPSLTTMCWPMSKTMVSLSSLSTTCLSFQWFWWTDAKELELAGRPSSLILIQESYARSSNKNSKAKTFQAFIPGTKILAAKSYKIRDSTRILRTDIAILTKPRRTR